MVLFINCWFFDGYVSKSEIDDDSAIFVDCGIASLKSDDENKKFWILKEPLAIEVVKTVLSSQYKQPTEALIKYLAIGRLIDFNNKTVSEFVNEIHGNQSNLPEWTKEAVIKFKSYGNLEMFSRLDKALKNDLDVIDSFLYESTFSEYMLIPGQFMRPDGVYIGKLDQTYWTLLISAKILTENLSGKKIDEDKQSTDWKLMYYTKDIESEIKCNELRKKFDDMVHFESITYYPV
ncbi:hypothetical protein C1646_677080 [Rhizophagus diaphanus]|nr:hypothetical protein C1646_677080 [Rhizophagus diaphanus] [Rhizophagus sp. MUCL 43196]